MGGRRRGPPSIVAEVDFGTAELIPDTERQAGWTLLLDGLPQSHVDLAQPQRLCFDYMRWLGWIVDAAAPPRKPLRVLHLGGGALALPRYIAATRPGSTQLVIERDAALVTLIRETLPLPRKADIRVRVAEAAHSMQALSRRCFDLIIADLDGGGGTMAAEVAQALSADGIYAMNVITRGSLTHVGELRRVFPSVCVLADPTVLRGKRSGNFVLAAGHALPAARLGLATARDNTPVRLVTYGRATSPLR